MSVQVTAFILLVLRLVSLAFVLSVLRKQLRLFKMNVPSELIHFRIVMFILGIVLLCGSFLPIATDIYYAFMREGGEFNIIVYYAISNAVSALAASILLWNIYRIAGEEIEVRNSEK